MIFLNFFSTLHFFTTPQCDGHEVFWILLGITKERIPRLILHVKDQLPYLSLQDFQGGICISVKHSCVCLKNYKFNKLLFMQVEYSFFFLPYNLAFDLQRIEISSIIDFLPSKFLASALRNQVEHSSDDNAELVLDLAVFHFHRTSFHGSSRQVCSGLVGCCWA